MKKCMLSRLLIALFLTTSCAMATQDRTSQTFMFTRPLYQNISVTNGIWDDITVGKRGDNCFAAQFNAVYQHSIKDWCPAKKYFLLNCKPVVTVIGDNAPLAGYPKKIVNRDIRAEWLNLDDTFEGKLTISPEQRQAGGIIELNTDLYPLIDWDFFKSWWVGISIPIFNVRNKLNTTGSSPEVLAALKRNDLEFARLIECEDSKTGIGEIAFKLGGTFLNHDGFLLSYFTGLGIPGERSPQPTRLFPATLGNHGHATLFAGIAFRLPLLEYSEACNLRFFFDIENRYYIDNHQCRTFDLKNKQWSRYMPVRLEGIEQTIPAANVLTQRVEVKPHSFTDLSTGLEFSSYGWYFAGGYNLWTHATEQLKFSDLKCDKIQRSFTRYGLAGITNTTSASESTIAVQAANDTDFVTINETDIDLNSGAGRGATVNRIHGVFSYYDECAEGGMFGTLGAFYEFPSGNTALKNWGVWAKIGTEF
jgi:hypothetical protein